MSETHLEGFRLSPQQKHQWLFQADPCFAAQCMILLQGSLHYEALQSAIALVMQSYEIVRTTFPLLSGMNMPLQVPGEKNEFLWSEIDLSDESEQSRSKRIHDLLSQLRQQQVDLVAGPVLITQLLKLSDRQHLLLLKLPALCADAETLRILVADISSAYSSWFVKHEPSDQIEMQYADIAEWQNELLESEETASGQKFWQAYWQRHAISTLLTQHLPLEQHSLNTSTGSQQHLEISFAPEIGRAVDALALAWEIPASTIYFACWQVLLCRLLTVEQTVIGVAFDGRKYAELAGVPGPLTRYIPLPSSYAKDSPVREVARQTNEMIDTVQEWQEYFNQDALQTVPASFGFDFVDLSATYAAAALTLSIVSLEAHTEPFKIRLSCIRLADRIRIEFHYDASLYTAESMQLLAARFQAIVSEVVAHPESTAGDLEFVRGRERTQLLVDWNATAGTYPQDACFHHLFEAQVQRTPDAIAIIFKEESLTYFALNQRANQLAHYLQQHGAGPEIRVGLWVERSLDALIGILGILKAGGVYVPLEPAYPLERLRFILQDSQISLLVTRRQYQEEQQKLSLEETGVVYLDQDSFLLAQQPSDNPAGYVAPENLAYVIYTSGSTGKPKGVLIEHHSPLNLLNALERAVYVPFLQEHPQLSDSPLRVSLNAPLVFDASIQQLIMLLRGHCLCLIPQEIRVDGEELLRYLRQHNVQVFDCTCSQLKILLATGLLEETRSDLQAVYPQLFLIGGEAIDEHIWSQLLQAPHLWFYNVYGPTECTVDVTVMRIGGDSPRFNQPLIGRPLANYQIYLFDDQLRPVPVGVLGEIYIGGAGLARGYHMRADLTAERFIPHPFSSEPGRRLYKTGDLARFHTNGQLQFVRRIDDQIKLRGYRIELGEIESVMLQHSAVQEIAVILREDWPGEPNLVAYFTLLPSEKEGSEESAQTVKMSTSLRLWAQEHLPAYMVPTFFVQLGHMPYSVNGKVDRRALPAPGSEDSALKQVFVAPRTPTEKALADVWAEVLGVDKVGIDDNFFDLGGDSIRSIRIQALAHQQDIQLTIQDLFRNQTIRALTQAIDDKLSTTLVHEGTQPFSLISAQDRALLPQGVVDAYPLTMLQAGMIFHSELDPDTSMYQNMCSAHLQAPLRVELFQQAVQALVARHPILRTAFDLEHYSQPLQLVYETADVPLLIEDLRQDTQAEQEQKLVSFREAEKMRHFDWSRAPLIRFSIHLRSADTFQITLTEHHCILDGWSVASLLTELFSHYWYLMGNTERVVAEPPGVFFRDFVALELQALKSVEAQTFWEKMVDQAPFTALPRWPSSLQVPKKYYPQPRKFTFSQDVTARLTHLAQIASVPLKSVLLAAHLYVLGTLSCSADVLTGVVSNGRPEMLDGDRALGIFLNTLPFRLHLSGATWLDLIKKVFQVETEMMPFRRYPMAKLQARQGRRALFETAFNFAHFHVYQSIQDFPGSEPLDMVWSEETNLTLFTRFVMAPYTSQLTMDLLGYELSDEQVEAFEGYYQRTLEAMISDPLANYHSYSFLSPDGQEERRQGPQSEILQRQLEYWRRQLQDAPRLLSLPTKRPHPAVQSYAGSREELILPVSLCQGLQELSQREGVTLYMTLLAAYQVLLFRYSGQTDILVGTPIANRTQRELESPIDFFVNILVMRSDLSGNPSFRHLLARVREVVLEAFAHQDLPFEKLVDALQIKQSPGYAPLFQVCFVFQNALQAGLRLSDLTSLPATLEHTAAHFDLAFNLQVTEQGLCTSVEYVSNLFDTATIHLMLGHWQTLLEAIVENAEQRIANLALMTVAERTQLLEVWNNTQMVYQHEQGLHQLFERQVERTPDALALVYLDEQLTYAALNQRANQLAHLLQTYGVGPEVVVGICLNRSLELFIGIQAVLKAGGAYLPLDVSAPVQHLGYMLREARPRVILTLRSLTEDVVSQNIVTSAVVLYLDELLPSLARCPVSTPVVVLDPAQPAYVIYTSGSTGRPKGVVLPHRALLNLCTWQKRILPTAVGTRVLQFATLNFDVSCQEMFTTWQEGGTLVVLPHDELRRDPETVLSFLAQQQIERLFVPYVALQQLALLAGQHDEHILKIRCIITAGEQLHVTSAIVAWMQRMPGCRLYNHYGPSETHVVASHLLEGDASHWPLLPPIGRPIDNMQVYILDEEGQVVPSGVIGEVYLGGDNLARGYLQRPDLTAERFVPHPFSHTSGARMYRTGDLARYLPDGAVEFLGRIDRQVKMRGFRIELEEIEGALKLHPAVQESVVVVREEEQGDRQLVAYVVPIREPQQEKRTLVAQLRSFLKTQLAEYALPAHYVVLESLPLTPNGKIDRCTLPAPERDLSGSQAAFVAPQTQLQERLAAIWCELLHLSRVGIQDDFFELGGHSLLATQLMMRIRATFKVDILLRSLFEGPTIEQMAACIDRLQNELINQADQAELERMISVLEELSDDELQSHAW